MIITIFLWFLIGVIFGGCLTAIVIGVYGDSDLNDKIAELRATRLEAYKTHTGYIVGKLYLRQLNHQSKQLEKMNALHEKTRE